MTSSGSAGRADIDPLVVSVAEAARMLGISKTLAYGLVARQELPSVRVGGRVRVPRRALERLAEGPEGGRWSLCRSPVGSPSATPTAPSGTRLSAQTGAGADSAPPPGPNQIASDSTTQLSLFECASESPSTTKTRTRTKNQTTTTRMNTTKPSRTPTETTSTLPVSTTSTSDPYLLLTRSNEPDALAPGVRRGRVNVPGNGAGGRSALNGNPDGEAGSGC